MDWLWGLVFAVSLCFCDAGKRTTSEIRYVINFLDSMKSCKNFDNNILDMSELEVQYDTPSSTSLTGNIKVIKTLGDGDVLEMTGSAYKEEGIAGRREIVGYVSGNVCKYIKDKDAPWTPLFAAMGVESCPIKAGTYPIKSLKFNLDYAEGMPGLNNQCVGEYLGILALHKSGEGVFELEMQQISCHEMSFAIVEYKGD